jgi:hypothetical protein
MKPLRLPILVTVLFLSMISAVSARADLLGVTPGYPNTTFFSQAGTSYNPATGILSVTSSPQLTTLTSGATALRVGLPRALSIAIQVDSAGQLAGGVAGDDLVLTGTLAGTGYSGTLLTGEIIEYGIRNAGATDFLDFRFRVTGGSLAPLFAGQDLAVSQTIETSSFGGSFESAFSGGAKGNLGPIPPKTVCAGVIGDFVWNDQNRNGIQDAGEPGLDNVKLQLSSDSGTPLASVVSGPNGAYLFSGLCPGNYTVSYDAATLPAGFVASPTLQGGDSTRDSNKNASAVTLSSGNASDRSIDFGFNSPCSGVIGDLVWHDQNRNGIQEPGEPGMNGVAVTLHDPATGQVITATSTNATGNYQFSGLCAGNYRVEVAAPSGFVATPSLQGTSRAADSNPNPSDVTLTDDYSSELSIDFGFNTPCTGSIGDLVWLDLNRNGLQDAGEPGMEGVRVLLKDSFSNPIASATTTANGFYRFTGLCADSYRVEVDSSSLPAGLTPSPVEVGSDRGADSNPIPSAVTLSTDASSDATIDFGYYTPCSGRIGDLVWLDANRDGIQSPGETGINGVTLTLKDPSNTTIATTTSGLGPLGQAGYYSFSGLCAGRYAVELSTPQGLVASPVLSGSDSTVDSNPIPAPVVLASDSSIDPTIDFGFNPPCSGSIGNLVWDDLNRDGLQDAGEPGIDGVTVRLRDASGVLLASTTSASGGLYQFGGLCAGSYQVEVMPPSGRSASPALSGSDRAADSNPNPSQVTLPDDFASDQTVDFGFNTPCSGMIGDLVWHDANRNGIQEPGEAGIGGAAVTLKNSQGTVIASTNSNASGGYLFGGLCAGAYTVEVATPAGFVASPTLAGSDREMDSNPVPAPASLSSDQSQDFSIDFGFNTPCAGVIGDLVWNDVNLNGIQDAGEPGIAGAAVFLRDTQNTLLRSTATLSDGSYRFSGLCAGSYRVEVAPPAGMIASPVAAGGDTNLDSNPNPAPVSLAGDLDLELSIDFGFYSAVPGLSLAVTCSDAPAPGQAIQVAALITNSGNETLTGISCSDSLGNVLAGVPASLAPGATAQITTSYLPAGSGSVDSISCNALGAVSSAPIAASAGASCGILTSPGLRLSASCQNAPAPGLPIAISALLTNSGNETLTGISCSDSQGIALSGVPATLAAGASATLSGSYLPAGASSTDTITCQAQGAINAAPVSASSSSSCGVTTTPALTLSESCQNAPASGLPIAVTAVLSNTGNETLTDISCSGSRSGVLGGVPAILLPGATAALTGSYVTSDSPATDSISCSARGALNGLSVAAVSSATCSVNPSLCLSVKKQVSTNCTVTGGKDKHCKSEETKDDHCKRGDADFDYCNNQGHSKQSYCGEVSRKQAHCGSNESKNSHCIRSDCDRSYCDRKDLDKDDYCKIPPAPVCVPIWLDADSVDTGATLVPTVASGFAEADDLLGKLSSGAFLSNQLPEWLVRLKHALSRDDSDEAEVQDADRQEISGGSEDRCNSAEYYQGHQRQSGLAYRFVVENCGPADLAQVVIDDPLLGIAGQMVGPLKAGESMTLTSQQIPQLSQPKFTCSASFVNTVVATGRDALGRSVSASDQAWVLCNTKNCSFTQGYWKNHPGSWPVSTLKLGSVSYSQAQLLAIFGNPPAGNGLTTLAHQLIAAKLNVANGATVPTAAQQAIQNADALIGSLVVPPVGSGSLAANAGASLVQTLTSYNEGTLAGGPSHCGETPPQSCTGKIGDFVWNDLNKNGVQNSGEPGLSGITVTLSDGRKVKTDATGHYLFSGVCPGSYTVKVSPPCGISPTTATTVNLEITGSGSSVLSADFGFAKPSVSCSGKIGDFIWNDLNKNGIQDYGEPGLSGVQLTLSNGASEVSDASGYYQFTGLCAGEYQVSVAAPTGFSPSAVAQGSNPSRDSKPTPTKVTLGGNASSVMNIDFGFFKTSAPACTGVIGNYVWNDLNKNGIQDCKEPGIAGVQVKLSNGKVALSDADGHYQFSGLCTGNYTVTVLAPDGYAPSPTLKGTSRASDSNPVPSAVSFSDNRGSDLSIDFGFWKLPTPKPGAKGCNHTYWKGHTANWPASCHGFDDFDSVFGVNAFGHGITFLQALGDGSGSLANLARQAAAALLNAQDSRVNGFPLTPGEVKGAVAHAIATGNHDGLAARLASYNNLGCPF